MKLVFVVLVSAVALALGAPNPDLYDQRQKGQVNTRVDLKNVVSVLVAPEVYEQSTKAAASEQLYPLDVEQLLALLELKKSAKTAPEDGEIREAKDLELTKEKEKHIVDNEIPDKAEPEIRDSGLLLLGAMEQCAPDQYRDDEGVCQLIKTKQED